MAGRQAEWGGAGLTTGLGGAMSCAWAKAAQGQLAAATNIAAAASHCRAVGLIASVFTARWPKFHSPPGGGP